MYELIVLIAGLSALFLVPPTGRNNKNNLYGITVFFLWVIIFITIAFRGETVGADTTNYINKYLVIKDSASYADYGGVAFGEPLFYYLNKLLSVFFGTNAQCIIVFEAIVVVVTYAQAFRRYSINEPITILGFLSLGLFATSLCLVRQFIAMSVCVFSLRYVINRNIWKFVICVIIASLIHYTAVFWIVVYFACNAFAKNNTLKIILYLLFGVVGYLSVDVFQEAASGVFDRWSNYSEIESNAAGYISFTIFALITLMVFMYRKPIISTYPYANVMMNINYLNMILWAMRLVTRNTERISFYFTIAPILLIPVLYHVISKKHGNVAGGVFQIIVVVCMVALYWVKITKDKSIYPFEFMNFNTLLRF